MVTLNLSPVGYDLLPWNKLLCVTASSRDKCTFRYNHGKSDHDSYRTVYPSELLIPYNKTINSGLTNIAAATTTLQHTRCTQTDNQFTTTAYYCQGQRQPEDRQGAV